MNRTPIDKGTGQRQCWIGMGEDAASRSAT
jgi:hypothetical protein